MKGLLFAILLLSACKSIEESRDRKALGRVLSSETLTAKVGSVLPPCANDTVLSSITDTLRVVDVKVKTDYKTIKDTVYATISKTETVERVVTQNKLIVDNRLAAQLRDSADKYKRFYIAQNERANVLQATSDKWKGKSNTRLWIIISLGLLIVGGIVAEIYSRLK